MQNQLVAIHRLREYFLRRHLYVDAGRDTERTGCAVPDDVRDNFYGRLLRRLRATWRTGPLLAREHHVRAGALLPRHRSRPGNNYSRRREAGARSRSLLRFLDGDSADTQGDIQGALVHDRPLLGPAYRVLAARLRHLLPLHDGGGDLRHRVRHNRLQLDRRHRYRDHDNDTARPAVSPDGGDVLQSAVSAIALGRLRGE